MQDCVNHDASLYRRLVITNLSLQWQPNQVDLVGIEEESYQEKKGRVLPAIEIMPNREEDSGFNSAGIFWRGRDWLGD